MCIIDNLMNILDENNVKMSELCSYLNINTSTMANWKTRKTDPPAKYIAPICEFLDISLEKLLLGKEKSSPTELSEDEQRLLSYYKVLAPMEKGEIIGKAETLAELRKSKPIRFCPPAIEDNEEDENEKDYLYLDLYVLPASAGTGIYMEHSENEPLRVPCTYETESANFALKISGDSMMPKYNDGDVVLVKTQPAVDFGEIGIFIYGGDAYIKKWGGNKLISLNPDYNDILIKDIESLYIKGKVLGKL